MYSDLLVHCCDDTRWLDVVAYARHFVDSCRGVVTCLRDDPSEKRQADKHLPDAGSVRNVPRGTLPLDQALLRAAALADAVLLDGFSDWVTLRRVVCESARPCVVVPATLRAFSPPQRVGIGWNDSLQCRRALHAALPLLRCAQEVLLFRSVAHARDVGEALKYLRRFDIDAVVLDSSAAPAKSCDRLSELSRQYGIDLLVAGAFPHDGFGDWDGAATLIRLVQIAEIPLLLAH
jgi:hypothetical protein